jgi:hypothetical protein
MLGRSTILRVLRTRAGPSHYVVPYPLYAVHAPAAHLSLCANTRTKSQIISSYDVNNHKSSAKYMHLKYYNTPNTSTSSGKPMSVDKRILVDTPPIPDDNDETSDKLSNVQKLKLM